MTVEKYFSLLLVLNFFSFLNAQENLNGLDWNSPEIVNPEQLNPSLWNHQFLESDIKHFGGTSNEFENDFPIRVLPFPVVDYQFGASGAGEFFINDQHQLSISYFLIGKHDYNKHEFKEEETHYSFFNLIILTDTLDEKNYSLVNNYITSRNHPDYVGEGRTKTKKINIDYVCFHRPDHSSYAIIGSKLFNLKDGQTVIAVVKENTAVHFMQLKTPRLTHDKVRAYISTLAKEKFVLDFLNAEGNVK